MCVLGLEIRDSLVRRAQTVSAVRFQFWCVLIRLPIYGIYAKLCKLIAKPILSYRVSLVYVCIIIYMLVDG